MVRSCRWRQGGLRRARPACRHLFADSQAVHVEDSPDELPADCGSSQQSSILQLTLGAMRLQPLPEDCLCLSRVQAGVLPPLAATVTCRKDSTS